MATRPGPLSAWPWAPLGDLKYALILGPLVAAVALQRVRGPHFVRPSRRGLGRPALPPFSFARARGRSDPFAFFLFSSPPHFLLSG